MSGHNHTIISIEQTGMITHIDDDEICLSEIGPISKKRASHIEPDPDDQTKWLVDLTPVGGPIIKGFTKRRDALFMEEKWIEENIL